ncbi:tryptophan synthase beta subunit-like PLP-dependent enzyme [Neurospora intermedia]|uniref:L-serine ammonia-lyase n=1 Tax=Neurospora intermedia TaxID=5142 RepID=A0ABR3D1B2_NEUIN
MGSVSFPASSEPPKPWVETPLIYSAQLSNAAGCNIYLKLENVQPSGSFKSRGIGNMMLRSTLPSPPSSPSSSSPTSFQEPPTTTQRKIHFFCSSAGNAGLACATTAHTLACPATIVVPTSAQEPVLRRLRGLGATVVIHGSSWFEADTHLREVVMPASALEDLQQQESSGGEETKKTKQVYVPPFDHEDIWSGAATLMDEVAEQMRVVHRAYVDAVVCNVGGGGLLNGIMEGVWGPSRNPGAGKEGGLGKEVGGGKEPRVLAIETVGADSFNQSVKAGELVKMKQITSIASSLGAVQVSKKTWEWSQMVGGESLVSATVTDAEAAMASVRFADEHRMLVEVSCGATLATAYNGDLRRYLGKGLSDEEWRNVNVVMVVCGGSHVSVDVLKAYREKYGPEIAWA